MESYRQWKRTEGNKERKQHEKIVRNISGHRVQRQKENGKMGARQNLLDTSCVYSGWCSCSTQHMALHQEAPLKDQVLFYMAYKNKHPEVRHCALPFRPVAGPREGHKSQTSVAEIKDFWRASSSLCYQYNGNRLLSCPISLTLLLCVYVCIFFPSTLSFFFSSCHVCSSYYESQIETQSFMIF